MLLTAARCGRRPSLVCVKSKRLLRISSPVRLIVSQIQHGFDEVLLHHLRQVRPMHMSRNSLPVDVYNEGLPVPTDRTTTIDYSFTILDRSSIDFQCV